MSDLSTIRSTIMDARLDEDDLRSLNHFVVEELKAARQRQARLNIHDLRVGGQARVTGRLRGDAHLGEVGTVIRINRTRVVMQFGSAGSVTIPASVLAPHNE